MKRFEDRKDVEEWLEPLSYEEFWREIAAYPVALFARDQCDADIRRGRIDEATALRVLKALASTQIIARERLPPRDTVPWLRLH